MTSPIDSTSDSELNALMLQFGQISTTAGSSQEDTSGVTSAGAEASSSSGSTTSSSATQDAANAISEANIEYDVLQAQIKAAAVKEEQQNALNNNAAAQSNGSKLFMNNLRNRI